MEVDKKKQVIDELAAIGIKSDNLTESETGLTVGGRGGRSRIALYRIVTALSGLAANETNLFLEFERAAVTWTNADEGDQSLKSTTIQLAFEEASLVRDFSEELLSSKQAASKDLVAFQSARCNQFIFLFSKLNREVENDGTSGEPHSNLTFEGLKFLYTRSMSKSNRADIKISVDIQIDQISSSGNILKTIGALDKDLADICSLKIYTMERRASVAFSSFISGQGIIIPSLNLSLTVKQATLVDSSSYSCSLVNSAFLMTQAYDNSNVLDGNIRVAVDCVTASFRDRPTFKIKGMSISENLKENSVDVRSVVMDTEMIGDLVSSLAAKKETFCGKDSVTY